MEVQKECESKRLTQAKRPISSNQQASFSPPEKVAKCVCSTSFDFALHHDAQSEANGKVATAASDYSSWSDPSLTDPLPKSSVFADMQAKISQFAMEHTPMTPEDEAQQLAADTVVQVVTSCEAPYRILWASKAWLTLFGFEEGQVLGQTLSIIQGPVTTRIDALMNFAHLFGSASDTIINHASSGAPFMQKVYITLLRGRKGTPPQLMQVASTTVIPLPPAAFAAALHHVLVKRAVRQRAMGQFAARQ